MLCPVAGTRESVLITRSNLLLCCQCAVAACSSAVEGVTDKEQSSTKTYTFAQRTNKQGQISRSWLKGRLFDVSINISCSVYACLSSVAGSAPALHLFAASTLAARLAAED